MKKRLWQIFGPILIAGLLTTAFFLFPRKEKNFNDDFLQKAAISLNEEVLKGDIIKDQGIKKGYMPVLGSSELARFSPFHPSVLQEKYHQLPPLFLMGSAGTQSLIHFFNVHALPLENKKAVVIISPQWFVPKGIKNDYFNFNYSPQLVENWLATCDGNNEADRYTAGRLLQFSKVQETLLLDYSLKKIRDGENLPHPVKRYYELKNSWNRNEEIVFSQTMNFNNDAKKINKLVQKLPEVSNQQLLRELALKEAKGVTTTNPFRFKNSFYEKNILPNLDALQKSQKNFNYTKSPEFSDFQLILNDFAKKNVTPFFVIPPVNKRWSDYTGLSQEMLKGFSKKIQYQLNQQGFHHILDLGDKASEDYFLEDTIHLGWLGWLDVNDAIEKFVKEATPTPDYHLDDKFFSKEWQVQSYKTIP